jgi:cytochrome c biogenesis protein CcmG/thiol:disulfide interchange protein DsbE
LPQWSRERRHEGDLAMNATLRRSLPLAIFLVVLAFLFVGLFRDPREVPSPLIDKPAPAFSLTRLHEPELRLTNVDMQGQVWLLNVWASWCVSCRVEHPLLLDLAKANVVPVIGLAYKDQPSDGLKWLASNGDPYKMSIVDLDGRVGIDFGVYGVPETFVIDKAGVIRYKQIGPLTADALKQTILPLVRKLQQS